jgi:hypothetical protein
MIYLALFLCGVIFALLIIPLLSCIGEWIYSLSEIIKSKCNIIITKNNVTTSNLNTKLEKSCTNAIGFKINSEEEYSEDDGEEECKSNTKQRIGFQL